MEWKCITQIDGDSLLFSKDWTNLFTSNIDENFVCVLSFKYKKFNKLNSRKQNSCQGFIQDFCLGGGGRNLLGASTKRGNVRRLGVSPLPGLHKKF